MADRFTCDNLTADYKQRFKAEIRRMIGTADPEIEGFQDQRQQRSLSVKYVWGHDHDFGEFSLKGAMGDRHIDILSGFMDNFGLESDLSGKKVLDIGVWTGGTSLLLAALGAEVTALEEVVKYSNTVNYLAAAFGLSKLQCEPISLYDLDVHDVYDYVIYSGVIYHVTDPVLSLRILFNSLKDNGQIFIETYGIKDMSFGGGVVPMVLYEGSKPWPAMKGQKSCQQVCGWNWFRPAPMTLYLWAGAVGFEDIKVSDVNSDNRISCAATRRQHTDMLRAGLSRPHIR